MVKRCDRLAGRLGRSMASANPALFYHEFEARPGDLIDQVSGLGITLESGTPIQAIEWTFGAEGRTTRWLVGDEREEGGG